MALSWCDSAVRAIVSIRAVRCSALRCRRCAICRTVMRIYGGQEAHLNKSAVSSVGSPTVTHLQLALSEVCGTWMNSDSDRATKSQAVARGAANWNHHLSHPPCHLTLRLMCGYMLCSTSAIWRVMIQSVCSTMHLAAGQPAFT